MPNIQAAEDVNRLYVTTSPAVLWGPSQSMLHTKQTNFMMCKQSTKITHPCPQ